jgi:hypothetical protein
MTKNIVVPGSTPVSVEVAKLIEARNDYAFATGSTYGLSKVYADCMLVLFPYIPGGKKPLFCKESGAEFEAWKGAALIAATKADTNKVLETADGLARFKAKLRDRVREVREQAAMICGIDTGNGAKANEKRDTLDWLKEEAPKWLRRVNRDESGNAKVIKAYDALAKLCKELGLNPAEIIAKSET